jgi:hypothetical protein
MSEHEIVTTAQAEIAARDAAIAERDAAIARLTQERDAARALLIQNGLATADEATEPDDGART